MMEFLKKNINKENMKAAGVVAGKIGKAIVIEGVKGVLLKSAATAITTSFDSGIEGVKKLTIDDYVGRKKKRLIELPKVKEESEKDEVVVYADVEIVEKRDVH